MPRRPRPRRDTQKAKHKKRPRGWHRRSKKPVGEIAYEVKRDARRADEAERAS